MTPRTNLSLSADASHAGEHHEHITPLWQYLAIFGSLLVLTVVTVGISYLGIPQPWSLIIAMIVAATKATLVVTVFMHLLWDKALNALVLLGAVFFMVVFFTLTMTDLLSRDLMEPLHGGQAVLLDQQAAYEACIEEKKDWTACKPLQPRGYVYANPDYSEEHAGDHAAPAAGHEPHPDSGAGGGH